MTDAMEVLLFRNGPRCGQSPTAIRDIIDSAHSSERIRRCRDGMRVWRRLGLTVRVPGEG